MADIKFSQFNVGNNCQVGDIVVGLRSGNNYKFTFPGTGIEDADGNFLIEYLSAGAGAVNHLFIESAEATFAPEVTVRGDDADINLQLRSKGTSSVLINDVDVDSSGNISEVATVMFSGSTSGQAILKAQAVAGTPTLQLPTSSGTLALTSDLPTLPLSLAEGGTGAALVANNGGIFYSNSTTGAILSGTATANQVLMSGSSSAPSWSTATYPPTTTVSQLLYSSSSNVVAGLSTANGASLVTTNTGVPVWSNTMTNGQVVIGSTGGQPQAASLTAGTGITIMPGANAITISSSTGGGGLVWSAIVGTTQLAVVNSGYIPTDVALTTITLPDICALGSMISIQGEGSGGWLIQAGASQTIHIGSSASSVAGTVTSANRYDAITLVCIVENDEWAMYGPVSSGFVIT